MTDSCAITPESGTTSALQSTHAVGFEPTMPADAWILRLYVAGQTPRSLRAVANVQKLCAETLHDRYTLEVIDLYQQPQLAQGEQIIAVPTLIKRLPAPLRLVIGDMSDTERVLVGLDLLLR